MDLVVVESPTKARTLGNFLGKGYSVEATMGHIKDLPKSDLGVDIEKNFAPHYDILPKKEPYIKRIKQSAKKAAKVFIATDPDREGEAIALHVSEVLSNSEFKKSKSKIKRIVFHEITKRAVNRALENPKDIDKNLVKAQVARRVLDRLVGYKLSPLLWKKVRRGLSAGRVQSVTVRLIVEREREIEDFKPKEYWEIFCILRKKREKKFEVRLVKIEDKKAEIGNKANADKVVSELEKSKYEVLDVKKREVRKSPFAPFTTSTMTQSAARLFGFSARRTMSLAQRLYEEGLITYHRTDSTNIASSAIERARKYIKSTYGEKYLPERAKIYKRKSKAAQEAHEAIRPTKIKLKDVGKRIAMKDANRLYFLIWKRFIACQMADSIYDETVIEVKAGKEGRKDKYLLRASGQTMKFDGWRVLMDTKKEKEALLLPEVKKEDPLSLIKVNPLQKFTQPPARYNEASLIKTLEKLGIGRPSTYAPIISTIQRRQYVEKKEARFFPTPVGVAVNDFLVTNFPKIFDYSFTAEMEDDLDSIADGSTAWQESVSKFWNPFEKKLNRVTEKSKRVKIEVEKLGKVCPKCKKGELVIRIGKFGKFVSCSTFPDCDYTEKYVEKIGFKCPECKKGDIVIKKTKSGKRFYGCLRFPDCKWASWKKPN